MLQLVREYRRRQSLGDAVLHVYCFLKRIERHEIQYWPECFGLDDVPFVLRDRDCGGYKVTGAV